MRVMRVVMHGWWGVVMVMIGVVIHNNIREYTSGQHKIILNRNVPVIITIIIIIITIIIITFISILQVPFLVLLLIITASRAQGGGAGRRWPGWWPVLPSRPWILPPLVPHVPPALSLLPSTANNLSPCNVNFSSSSSSSCCASLSSTLFQFVSCISPRFAHLYSIPSTLEIWSTAAPPRHRLSSVSPLASSAAITSTFCNTLIICSLP